MVTTLPEGSCPAELHRGSQSFSTTLRRDFCDVSLNKVFVRVSLVDEATSHISSLSGGAGAANTRRCISQEAKGFFHGSHVWAAAGTKKR